MAKMEEGAMLDAVAMPRLLTGNIFGDMRGGCWNRDGTARTQGYYILRAGRSRNIIKPFYDIP